MIHKFLKKLINSQLIIYMIRCVIGFLIGYFLMLKFPSYELFWSLLSIILVISPEGKDSMRLTKERVKSNFIGSLVGLTCHFIHPTNTYVLIMGIMITSMICYLFNVMNMSRVAIVSFLIVMLQTNELNENITPIFRFATVAIGCLIGLAIIIVTSFPIKKLKSYYKI